MAKSISGMALAFDFGEKRIGVAKGQLLTATAGGLTILKAKDGIPDWQMIDKLLQEWQPDRLVVGLPFHMDGTETKLTARSRKFANRLHGRFGLPVHLVDERLTSDDASRATFEFGLDDEDLDATAAVLILRDYWASLN